MSFYFATGEMIALIGLVGFLLGWLISWALDWFFWRQKRRALFADLRLTQTQAHAEAPVPADTPQPESTTSHAAVLDSLRWVLAQETSQGMIWRPQASLAQTNDEQKLAALLLSSLSWKATALVGAQSYWLPNSPLQWTIAPQRIIWPWHHADQTPLGGAPLNYTGVGQGGQVVAQAPQVATAMTVACDRVPVIAPEVKLLQGELASARAQLKQLDAEYEEWLYAESQQTQAWRTQAEAHQAEIAQLQARLQQHATAPKEHSVRLTQMQGEVAQLTIALTTAQAELVTLQSAHATDLADAQAETAALQAKLYRATTQVQQQETTWQQRFHAETERGQAWQARAEQNQAEITHLQQQIEQAHAEQERLVLAQTQLAQQTTELAAAQATIHALQASLAEAQTALREGDEQHMHQLQIETQYVQAWQAQAETRQAAGVKHQEALRQVQVQLVEAQGQIIQLETTLANERQQFQTAATTITTIETELAAAQAELAQRDAEHTRSLHAEGQHTQYWQALAQTNQTMVAELQQRVQQTAQDQTVLAQFQTQVHQLETELSSERQRLATAQHEVNTLQLALTTATAAMTYLNGSDQKKPAMTLHLNGNGHPTGVGELTHLNGRQPLVGEPAIDQPERGQLARANFVDLVILIDTSKSMAAAAGELSRLLDSTLKAVQQQSQMDWRVCWFGIEGVWANTRFTQSYRTYLQERGIANTELVGRRRDTMKNGGAQKDGARALTDLSRHFDWRAGAVRLLFYGGDNPLDGGRPDDAAEVKAAQTALAVASARGVRIFTYASVGEDGDLPDVDTELQYQTIAARTGGRAYAAPMSNLRAFAQDLRESCLVLLACKA